MPKFMQSLDQEILDKLSIIAKKKGISVQELIRACVIPDWLVALEDQERKNNAE